MASSSNAVQFVVGNTYSKVPLSQAKLDRSGKWRKIHDWTLFVDVIEGNPDNTVDRVSFDLGPSFSPRTFTSSTPVPKRGNIWSFQTRQQTYGPVTASIQIRGVGGSVLECSHKIQFTSNAHSPVRTFREARNPRPLKMLKMPNDACFGIELELTSAVHVPPETVAQNLESTTIPFQVVNDYRAGRATSSTWKLVPDSSIVCNTSMPNCNRFELVSPILKGGGGLNQVSQILKRLNDYKRREPHIQLSVNKSMGFHVHINVADLSHEELVKVCQNFVKYEAVMDTFMPPSRRNGSPESDRFFQSNRTCVAQTIGSERNKAIHEALGACRNTASLAQVMNANERYYKLNLQNLVSTNRYQPTLEFRQHSATMNFHKVGAWIRFCFRLVHNSARLAPPSSFRENRDLDHQMEALFLYVIKDRALRNFYQERRQQLVAQGRRGGNDDDDDDGAEPCCAECATGGSCSASNYHY